MCFIHELACLFPLKNRQNSPTTTWKRLIIIIIILILLLLIIMIIMFIIMIIILMVWLLSEKELMFAPRAGPPGTWFPSER